LGVSGSKHNQGVAVKKKVKYDFVRADTRIKKSDSAYKRAEKLVKKWIHQRSRASGLYAECLDPEEMNQVAEQSLIRAIARELTKPVKMDW